MDRNDSPSARQNRRDDEVLLIEVRATLRKAQEACRTTTAAESLLDAIANITTAIRRLGKES